MTNPSASTPASQPQTEPTKVAPANAPSQPAVEPAKPADAAPIKS